MKFSTTLFGLALLMGSAKAGKSDDDDFFPSDKGQLAAAVGLLCDGAWPGDSVKYWQVQNITNFDYLFANTGSCNPDGIGRWEVAQATSLVGMFENTTGLDQDLSHWALSATAEVADFYDNACPPFSSPVYTRVEGAPADFTFILGPQEDSLGLNIDGVYVDIPITPVTDLGEMLDRCACDGGRGFRSFHEFDCVFCDTIDKRLGSKGVCIPICPEGAENDGDSCDCTSRWEEYEEDDNMCLCKKGAYGDGNGDCEECPEYTERKSGVGLGVGDIEDRCECVNSYEVWDDDEDMCVCEAGAYGDGDDDCQKCPSDQEAADDEDHPGTGDLEDRCQCKRDKYEVYDDDLEECVCKEDAYEKSTDKCYDCDRNKGMRAKSGNDEADGDIYERCECELDNAVLEDEKCLCDTSSYGKDGDDCTLCDDVPGAEARTQVQDGVDGNGDPIFVPITNGYGSFEDRCECTASNTVLDGEKCKCDNESFGTNGDSCQTCASEGCTGKVTIGVGYGSKEDRCDCPAPSF